MLERVWPLRKHDFRDVPSLASRQERFRDSQLSTCWAEKNAFDVLAGERRFG